MTTISATWRRIAASPELQRSSHGASVIGSSVYIFGGELKPREPRDNEVHIVTIPSTPSTASTLTTIPSTPSTPSPRVGSPTTVLGDTLYLFSGRGGPAMTPLDESGALWAFSSATRTWTVLRPADAAAPVPPPRSYHALAADAARHTVYLHAGCPSSGRCRDLWAFDVLARTWTEMPAAPGSGRGGAGLCVAAGRVWRFGGFDGEREVGGRMDSIGVRAGEDGEGEAGWETVEFEAGVDGPGARSVSALVPVKWSGKDVVLALFGEGDPSALGHAGAGKMWGDVWGWVVQEKKWRKSSWEGEGPEARGWFDADTVRFEDGTEGVVVVGGLGETNERLDDVWVLTLKS